MNDSRNIAEGSNQAGRGVARGGPTERAFERGFGLIKRLSSSTQDAPRHVVGRVDRSECLARARLELADRRRRIGIFGNTMFGEAGWEVLLALYVEHGARQTISRINQAVTIAPTTTLRWLSYLERHQWIRREDHPTDTRAVLIELTEKALSSLDLYFSETRRTDK